MPIYLCWTATNVWSSNAVTYSVREHGPCTQVTIPSVSQEVNQSFMQSSFISMLEKYAAGHNPSQTNPVQKLTRHFFTMYFHIIIHLCLDLPRNLFHITFHSS